MRLKKAGLEQPGGARGFGGTPQDPKKAARITKQVRLQREHLAQAHKSGRVMVGQETQEFARQDQRRYALLVKRSGLARQSHLLTPQGSADLLVRVWRSDADQPGSYLRIEAEQLDAEDRPLARFASIVGQRQPAAAGQLPVSALFHLLPQCASVRLKFSGAYRQTLPAIEHWSAEFLEKPNEINAHWPAGKVGLAMADPADVPTLLGDIVRHHSHYQVAARAFATRWVQEHAAEKTIRQLASHWPASSPTRQHAA